MIEQSLFDDILLKLKPKWNSKKIETIKMLYEIGDKDKKEQLFKLVSLSARQLLNDNLIPSSQILLPPSDEIICADGDITIGNVCYGYSKDRMPVELYPLKISYADMTEHVLIGGRTGQGKTTLAYNMAIQLADKNKNISLIIIDFNRSWRNIFSLSEDKYPFVKDARIYTVGRDDIIPFAGNILFSPPPSIPLELWINIAIGKPLERNLLSGFGSASLLSDTAEQIMKDYQESMSELLPNIEDVQVALNKNRFEARRLLWSQSAQRITQELTKNAVKEIFSSREPINIAEEILERKGITIIELDLLIPQHDKNLFTEVLFYYIYLYYLSKGEAEPDELRTSIFIEEAMNVLIESATAKKSGGNILHTLIREARKFGISLTLLGQEPSSMPNVLTSNVKTSIFFSNKSKLDIDAAASSLFLKKHQIPFIDLLSRGYAIAKISGRTNNMLIKILPPPFNRRVTDDELKELRKKWQHRN